MAYGKFALVYDRLMADMPYDDWVAFAEEAFRRHGQAPETVVDLGCGTGSITLPLSAKGYRMYGIDLSEAMLAVAQYKSGRLQAGRLQGGSGEPLWLEQDMTQWELPEQVDAAVSFCDCLNYLADEEEVAAVFRQTYAGLKPGGLFVFDVHTPGTLREYADNQPYVYNEDDLSYIWLCDLDEEHVSITHELTFFVREPGGGHHVRFDETHTQRAYPLERLAEMLGEAGFADIRTYGDFTWEEAGGHTARAFFTAVKSLS